MEKKIKIEIKSRWTGKVLFSFGSDNNTMKATVEEAVKSGADLRGADLGGADLGGVDLGGADLGGVDLRGADLRGANLRGADLGGADLGGADLRGADLGGVDLCGADLRGAEDIPFVPMACPSDGAFIGWKKIEGHFLVKLEIPDDAKRSSATGTKCRCDKAKVISIIDLFTKEPVDFKYNTNEAGVAYKVGEMVYPDSFDDDRWKECTHGIHFFINKQEAINY